MAAPAGGRVLSLGDEVGRVSQRSIVPAAATVATGLAVVLIAVAVWAVVSVLSGGSVDAIETLSFAAVFAVVYFGALSALDGREG